LRLKVQQVFPAASPHYSGGFPFKTPLCPVTGSRAGLPLSSHSNPRQVLSCDKQSRSFPRKPLPASSFSCRNGFEPNRTAPGAILRIAHPPLPLKAGYTAHSLWPHCRFSSQVAAEPHRLGSPREQDQGPHAIAACPIPLNSQHQPPTGRQTPAPGTSQLCH
jgi:hypothetical protein